jgi:PAS domain S-box-containing protein
MLFLSVVSGGIILGIALNEQKGNMETTLIQENKRLAEVAARSIEAGYIEQSWPFRTLKQINDSEDVLFWWIVKPDGMIHLADNPGMRGKRVDIASFEAEEEADVKDYVYGGEDIKFLVQPLCIGEPGKTWYLCIGISLKSLKAAANRVIFTSLSYFFLIIAFACALSFLLARRFTKPIMQLIGGTKAISRGDFDTKVKIKTGDEIEGLGDAFNKMAVQVKSSVALERAARKETENIMNTMVETLIVVDSEGNIRNANEATFDLLGYSEEELIAKSLSKITGKKEAEEKFERLLKEGSIKDFETTYLTKDGREVPVNFSASSLKDGNGELKGFVCVAGDITERKGAQEALRKSEEKYRTLIESSFTGIFIHQDGKYVFVNNRFAKIHGYTPEELLGREHWLLVRSDERETVRQKALKRLNGEAVPQSYEIRRLKKDGKTI